MNKFLSFILIINTLFAVDMKAKRKKEFVVTVTIINQDGSGIKKSRVVLLDKDGEKIKDGKTNKNGQYSFKKLKAGSYTLLAEHKSEGDGEKKFNLLGKDLDFTIKLNSDLPVKELVDDDLNLNQFIKNEKLPDQRKVQNDKNLKFEELFFDYETNLNALKEEIDSLKSVVKGYQKGQTMPILSEKI